MIANLKFDDLIADRGYDADAFLSLIEQQGAMAVIPSKKSRKFTRDYDT